MTWQNAIAVFATMTWQDVTLVAVFAAWACFERWVRMAYRKPPIELSYKGYRFSAATIEDMEKLMSIEMREVTRNLAKAMGETTSTKASV